MENAIIPDGLLVFNCCFFWVSIESLVLLYNVLIISEKNV